MTPTTIHKLRQEHMHTWFEIRIDHEDAAYARQAAQAAFSVTTSLDRLLNRYRDNSEVSQIRALVPGESLRLSPVTFSCLQIAGQMEAVTGGAFDPILGEQIDALRSGQEGLTRSERPRLILNEAMQSVSVTQANVALDLGAIGKGFALDEMAVELRTWSIERALLIAGESSILALDSPTHTPNGWEVRLTENRLYFLSKQSISTSGTSVQGQHILDPHTGLPASSAPFRTWAIHPSAAVSDALSTAWMLLEIDEIAQICHSLPGTQAFVQRLATTEPDSIP